LGRAFALLFGPSSCGNDAMIPLILRPIAGWGAFFIGFVRAKAVILPARAQNGPIYEAEKWQKRQ